MLRVIFIIYRTIERGHCGLCAISDETAKKITTKEVRTLRGTKRLFVEPQDFAGGKFALFRVYPPFILHFVRMNRSLKGEPTRHSATEWFSL